MRKRASIEFKQTKELAAPVLKFGGEPFGLPKERWPNSKATSEPMQFICQVPFGRNLFPGVQESIAYLFITSSEDQQDTWLPDGGENAVIILPREKLTSSLAVGDAPRLCRMVKKRWKKLLVPEACIFSCELSYSEDPDFITDRELASLSEEQRGAYISAIEGDKLGGSPYFIQSDELPFPENWHLLLQLDSATVPFWINFGDAGIGYVFINADGTQGKFLWQCC